MIKPGIENLTKWLQINRITSWFISTTNSGQDNTRLFTSDPEQSFESELERMRQVLELSSNPVVYVFGKTNAASKVGNFMERWQNGTENTESVSAANQPVNHAMYGTPTYVSREELDERIMEAVNREKLRSEKEAFEKEKEAFEQEQKEFADAKNSMIGIAIEKAMPFIGQLLGGNRVAVAGTQGSIQAAPIQPAMEAEPMEPVETEDAVPFTLDEQERITEVLERYKNYDPEYLEVLAKFVDLATTGKPVSVMNGMVKLSYSDIKQFILGA